MSKYFIIPLGQIILFLFFPLPFSFLVYTWVLFFSSLFFSFSVDVFVTFGETFSPNSFSGLYGFRSIFFPPFFGAEKRSRNAGYFFFHFPLWAHQSLIISVLPFSFPPFLFSQRGNRRCSPLLFPFSFLMVVENWEVSLGVHWPCDRSPPFFFFPLVLNISDAQLCPPSLPSFLFLFTNMRPIH